MKLLSLSKKANWSIVAILTLLKINNLQFIEKAKIAIFRVFRQARYIFIIFSTSKTVTIWFPYVKSGFMTSFGNLIVRKNTSQVSI
jgi:hypothetical protein